MSLATSQFTYRLSRLDGVPRIDVRGTVSDADFDALAESIDRLVDGGARRLVLSLSQAHVSRELSERLARHAHTRLPADLVLVDSALPAQPYA